MRVQAFAIAVLSAAMPSSNAEEGLVDVTKQTGMDEHSLSLPRDMKFGIGDFASVLTSEVDAHFGTRHLSSEESNDMWKNAVDYEWGRRLSETRRLTTGESSLSPYLVCDVDYGKLGTECHELVKQHFGEGMFTVYNDYDKSCYIVSATTEAAQNAPSSLVVTPLIPEAKLREGLIDDIEHGEPMPTAIHCIFAPGVSYTTEEAKNLADSIIQTLLEEADSRRFLTTDDSLRRHVSHSFLRTDADTKTRHDEMHEFWQRNLVAGMESGSCDDMYDLLQVEVADASVGFTVGWPTDDQSWGVRQCLHSLVAGFSVSDKISSVEARREMLALNAEARWVTQTGVRDSTPFFDSGLSGQGQVVQVSDTGIDLDNCYFTDTTNGNIATNGNLDLGKRKVVQYVPWANGVDGTRGHGTHVSGSVAGKREGADGVADGMAPEAKIAFFDIGFSGSASLSVPNNPSTLFNPGQSATAKISSASWGVTRNTYGFGEQLYDFFMANNDDFLFIVAAGNDGEFGLGSVGSPSVCKNGLSVGATQNAAPHIQTGQLGEDYLAAFSSRGPTSDGRAKPEVLAPGMFVRSAEARSDLVGECDDTSPDGLLFNAGTSMSTPIVSGTAALIRQYFEDGWYPGGSAGSGSATNPSSALVKAVLMNGGEAIAGIQNNGGSTSSSSAYDFAQRFGRINLINSLPLQGQNRINAMIRDREVISNNQVHTYDVQINRAGGCQDPLSATLVWTDPPASPGCVKCLLNDLDLEIDGPSGTVFPNGGSSADTVNNAERVRIDNASDNDVFAIRVRGANLDSASQAYALIVTGCFGDVNANPTAPVAASTPAPVTPVTSPVAGPTETIVVPNLCMDGNNEFFVDADEGNRNCMWLNSNMNSFPWLCQFRDIAVECPSTCGTCELLADAGGSGGATGEDQIFGVFPNGETRWQGNMFTVEVLKDMIVNEMFLHIRVTGARQVRIYLRDGPLDGTEFNPSAWGEPYVDTTVQAQGYGSLTTVGPDLFRSLTWKAGDVRSVYVTIVGGFGDLVVTEGDSIGGVLVSNDNMRILQGNAITFPFGGADNEQFAPFGMNGGFGYALLEGGACGDTTETFTIDSVANDQNCDWVAANTQRFDYVCDFLHVAVNCPQTCNFCDALQGRR